MAIKDKLDSMINRISAKLPIKSKKSHIIYDIDYSIIDGIINESKPDSRLRSATKPRKTRQRIPNT
jgi:hypothetical protein